MYQKILQLNTEMKILGGSDARDKGKQAQLLVRGQDQIKQVLKASVDPGEPEM